MKIFYNFFLVITIIFFCTFTSRADTQNPTWKAGQVVLWEAGILEGELSYNWLAEMVMIRQANGRIATLSANQVQKFGWFDYSQHKYREFCSIAQSEPGDKAYTNHVFFEVCMDGPLRVVRRLKRPRGFLKRAFGHPSHYTDQPVMAQNLDHFTYYVHDAGRLLALDRFYSDVYGPLMAAYDKQLRHYVYAHNINVRSLLGRLVIVSHYNFLVQQDARTASAKGYGGAPN